MIRDDVGHYTVMVYAGFCKIKTRFNKNSYTYQDAQHAEAYLSAFSKQVLHPLTVSMFGKLQCKGYWVDKDQVKFKLSPNTALLCPVSASKDEDSYAPQVEIFNALIKHYNVKFHPLVKLLRRRFNIAIAEMSDELHKNNFTKELLSKVKSNKHFLIDNSEYLAIRNHMANLN